MYKIFMLIAIPVLAIGWIAYYLWDRKMKEEEKNRPKPVSKRLQKTKNEMSDWAKQMAAYKPPKIKRSYEEEDEDNDNEDNKSQ